MKVILTGGTGLIGSRIIEHLSQKQHQIVALTRSPDKKSSRTNLRFMQWDAHSEGAWQSEFENADAVIHLAGEGIFDARWTESVKGKIVESRVSTTKLVVDTLAKATKKPSLLVSASAVGYYGNSSSPTDETVPPGSGFLADVCVKWEAEALRARDHGVRVANPRIGIVLDKNGGALGRMLPVFKAFLGMPLGSGKQWFPWVHADDVARAILFPLEQQALEGAYNLASPTPVTMQEFCTALGRALHRPSWSPLTVPEFALHLGLGEAASALIEGQNIVPKKLIDAGFEFKFSRIDAALRDILQ